MKRKELDRLNAELETLRNTAAGFENREAEIATMIEEAETDEERSAVQDEIESFEAERDATNNQIAELEESEMSKITGGFGGMGIPGF